MIVKHPTLQGVQNDVPDADVDRWKASGWLTDQPDPQSPVPPAEPDESALRKRAHKTTEV